MCRLNMFLRGKRLLLLRVICSVLNNYCLCGKYYTGFLHKPNYSLVVTWNDNHMNILFLSSIRLKLRSMANFSKNNKLMSTRQPNQQHNQNSYFMKKQGRFSSLQTGYWWGGCILWNNVWWFCFILQCISMYQAYDM